MLTSYLGGRFSGSLEGKKKNIGIVFRGNIIIVYEVGNRASSTRMGTLFNGSRDGVTRVINKVGDTTVIQMTARVATIEPWSNDFCKLVLRNAGKPNTITKRNAINGNLSSPGFKEDRA